MKFVMSRTMADKMLANAMVCTEQIIVDGPIPRLTLDVPTTDALPRNRHERRKRKAMST